MILERLCGHADSRLVCIDPWDDVYAKHDPRYDTYNKEFVGQYSRFCKNTANATQIIPIRGYSNDVLPTLEMKFDFAYIDGEHSPEQVYKDAVNVIKLMKPGGIMLFDDFMFEHNGIKTKEGILRFLHEYQENCFVLFQNYQLALETSSA